MIPYRDNRFLRLGLGAFFLLVVVYAYFEGRALIWGPTIEISPRVMEVSEPFITIQGKADRIATLMMNGMPIPIKEEGLFEEGYVLSPGYNRIVLDAQDKYGKKAQQVLEIVYNGTSPAPESEPSEEVESSQ